MWDNPLALRNLTILMLILDAVLLLFGAAYYAIHMPDSVPLRKVTLSVAPRQVDADLVRQVIHAAARGNLITVDIEGLRQSLQQVPWVRSVSIRREFPDRLEVQLEEHQLLASWNRKEWVNLQGEVFALEMETISPPGKSIVRAPARSELEDLPLLSGPEGTSEEVAQLYETFSVNLAALNLRISQLVLSPRYAWQMRLDNGMVVELGRENVRQRLRRFVELYPYGLASRSTAANGEKPQDKIAYVDLRYRNGFAVRRMSSERS
ncbi:MAG: cell division protein FtsQ/DivIB [Gallionella sp.]